MEEQEERRSRVNAVSVIARLLGCALLCCVSCTSCSEGPETSTDAGVVDVAEPHLVQLEKHETALRMSTDWETFRARDGALGPDPFDIRALANGHFEGTLRGAQAVVTLDAEGRELSRVNARVAEKLFRDAGSYRASVDVLGHRVIVMHAGQEIAQLMSDGPPLGVAVRAAGADVVVAHGLLEDHPLDRTIGSFGHIDSFVRVHRVTPDRKVERMLEMNTSALGVVTPKALAFIDDDTLLVVGTGSTKAARINISTQETTIVATLPGVVACVPTAQGFIGASPLLDAWVIVDPTGAHAVPVPAPMSSRSVDSKLGEALAFTTLIAPRQKSDGPLSRFTCEACHFEGEVDGRIHHTGRGEIVATTRPLAGLFNNTPLFTRALDPNITRMVHAEFRVAGANSTLDPWFALTLADAPWLPLLGVTRTQNPEDLRRALVSFLHDFTPRKNVSVIGRTSFSDIERRGAALYRSRCVRCHASRLVGDDPKTEQPFASWEKLIFADNGPLVWSSPERRKTGVEPYVHEEGARASSLRRLDRKKPYFTNGSSLSVDDVVRRARFDLSGDMFLHSSQRDDLHAFTDEEIASLLSFLRLL